MSRRSTTMLLLIAVALTIGVAWWWSQQGTPELPPIDAPVPAQPAPVAPADAPLQHVDPVRAALPAVWLEVQTVGTYVDGTAPVDVHIGDGSGQAYFAIATGGVGQLPADEDSRAGQTLIRTYVRDRWVQRALRLPGNGGRERLLFQGSSGLRGKVLGPDRKPIVGAHVTAGDGPDVSTGDDGAFALDVEATPGVPLVVRADGFAWTSRIVDGASTAPIEFVLAPECALTVRWIGAAGPVDGARAIVVPVGTSFTTELLAYPFFVQAQVPWRFDAQGQVVVRGLPRGATIGVAAAGPRLPRTAPQTVELLRPTAEASLRDAPTGFVVRGELFHGEDDSPLIGAAVHAWGGERAPGSTGGDRWLLAYADDTRGVTSMRSDREQFEVLVPDGARGTIAVVAGSFAMLRRVVDKNAGQESVRFPMREWRAGPHELRIPPPVTGTAWAVRIEPDREFTQVAADQPFVRAFAQPSLVNLRVRVALDGSTWSEPRVANDVTVLGSTALPAELLRR